MTQQPTVREALNSLAWKHQVSAAGTVGSNLDVTPTQGDQVLKKLTVFAPSANVDATLKIYKDSVSAANTLHDGYISDINADGQIIFPYGEVCATKWIVDVTGGSGDLIVTAWHD